VNDQSTLIPAELQLPSVSISHPAKFLLLALFPRMEAGRARQLYPGISDLDFLRDLKGIADLNAEVLSLPHLQRNDFGDPQTRPIGRAQRRLVLDARCRLNMRATSSGLKMTGALRGSRATAGQSRSRPPGTDPPAPIRDRLIRGG
jgi:hypothetical protein